MNQPDPEKWQATLSTMLGQLNDLALEMGNHAHYSGQQQTVHRLIGDMRGAQRRIKSRATQEVLGEGCGDGGR